MTSPQKQEEQRDARVAVGETPWVGRGREERGLLSYVPRYRSGLGSDFDLGGIGGRFAAETSFTGGWRRGHLVLGPAVLA